MDKSHQVAIVCAAAPSGVALIATYPGGDASPRHTVAECFWRFTGSASVQSLRINDASEGPSPPEFVQVKDELARKRLILVARTRVNAIFWKNEPKAHAPFSPRKDWSIADANDTLGIEDAPLIALAWAHPGFLEEIVASTGSSGLRATVEEAIRIAKQFTDTPIGAPANPNRGQLPYRVR